MLQLISCCMQVVVDHLITSGHDQVRYRAKREVAHAREYMRTYAFACMYVCMYVCTHKRTCQANTGGGGGGVNYGRDQWFTRSPTLCTHRATTRLLASASAGCSELLRCGVDGYYQVMSC